MKWALFVLSLALLLLVLGLRPDLGPYESLQRALRAPKENIEALWALASRSDAAGWVARLELAKVLKQEGQAAASVGLLKEAVSLYEDNAVRRELARALEEAGRKLEALEEWQKLLPEAEAASAIVRLRGIDLSTAGILVAGRAYQQALEVLSGRVSAEASLWRARALVGLGRLAEGVSEYEKYLAAFPRDSVAQLEYGQALERLGQTKKALEAYRAAGPAGLYRLGLSLESLGRLDEALSTYQRSADPEARWRAARLLEEKGRVSEALGIYRELAQSNASVADDAALRAHLIYVRQGQDDRAREMKEMLPAAFLWLLGERIAPPSLLADPWPISSEAVQVAESLLRRFPKEGELWARVEVGIALKNADLRETLAIGEWYAKLREWNRAYALGVRALSERACLAAYKLASPKAWEESVGKWAQEYGVDPCLVWAVMREESGFSPRAVSRSGAVGLMQILPSTARWIAERLGIPYREELLFDPDYNVRLGTWYLRHLLDQFGGRVAWAVAAYNGGPGNLRRWAAGIDSPPDLPAYLRSPETREYLPKVLNAWLIYRLVYQG